MTDLYYHLIFDEGYYHNKSYFLMYTLKEDKREIIFFYLSKNQLIMTRDFFQIRMSSFQLAILFKKVSRKGILAGSDGI